MKSNEQHGGQGSDAKSGNKNRSSNTAEKQDRKKAGDSGSSKDKSKWGAGSNSRNGTQSPM